MEETAASLQTETTTTFENSRTSRTKRSIIDNSSDNDEEFATSGFYVREKPDKSEKNSDESSNDSIKNKKEECIENGASNDASEHDVNAQEDVSSKDGENNKEQENAKENGSNVDSVDEDNEVDKNEGEDKPSDDNNEDVSNHSEKEQESLDPLSQENDNDKEEKQSDEKKSEENTVEEDQQESNKNDDAAADTSKEEGEKLDEDNSKESANQESDNVEKDKKSETNDCDKTESAEHSDKDEDKDNKGTEDEHKNKKGTEDEDKDKTGTEDDESKPETAKGSDDDEGEDMEVEVDFDPSLLCPDISMDVDEQPVVTGGPDGSTDDLLVARTTDVDEITGAEVTFNLTHDEMELRSRMYSSDNPVQFTKIHCTACNVHLGSALDGQANRFVHPLLKVLICKKCYHFYTSGDFEKDEDGSELYCRWCGQGGEVLCCSNCEFVFCKRCIKNNFGMKKFKEIRNSDDWSCFRCNMTQLQALRASCAEFWDYYRTQLTVAKASTITETDPTFVTTDHTKCCNQDQKNKEQAKSTAATRKRKRKNSGEDPDFVPGMQEEPKKKPFIPPNAVPTSTPGILVIRPTVSSTTTQSKIGPGTNTAIGSGQMFRVGNTTFRPRTPTTGNLGYTITRPKVSSSSTGPGYIKILPQKTTQATPRTQAPYTIIPPSRPSTSTRPTFTTIRPQNQAGKAPLTRAPQVNTVPSMKHEWFEKTVRAAARVNSNLSYTLTQLNRQQSQASSVESLAVVHNKLQEVLSTSINSLIQIRKNLRTEFIAGIKNIKFPPKASLGTPPPMVPLSTRKQVQSDDDDVIILSPPGSPSNKSPQQSTPAKNKGIVLGSGVSLTSISKTKSPAPAVNKPSVSTTPTSSKPVPAKSGGGYLKVKSFSALQSVTSECITIPDDPPVVSNPGSVADPLEFCQVDMNEDENSNHSQQSQTSNQTSDDKKIKEKSPDTTKSDGERETKKEPTDDGDRETKKEPIDKKEPTDDGDRETKKEPTDNREEKVAKEDDESNKNSGDEKDSNKMDVETKEDEKEASVDNDENSQDKPEEIPADEDKQKSPDPDKSEVEDNNENSQDKCEEISDDDGNKRSGIDISKVDKENVQDKPEQISDDEDTKKLDSDESKTENKETTGEKDDNHSENQDNGENEVDTNDESPEKGLTKNGDMKSTSDVEEEEEESESERLDNFVYNTTEEPTAEVKKWLGAKVVMKKSRVVDELVRVKNRVLNGDSDGS